MNGNNENYGNKEINGVMTGVVKHFKEQSYGFIVADDPKMDDVFIHVTEIEPWRSGHKELKNGQKVRFGWIKQPRKGKSDGIRAINLEILRDEVDESKFKIKNYGQEKGKGYGQE